jgi:hypothetical protein
VTCFGHALDARTRADDLPPRTPPRSEGVRRISDARERRSSPTPISAR